MHDGVRQMALGLFYHACISQANGFRRFILLHCMPVVYITVRHGGWSYKRSRLGVDQSFDQTDRQTVFPGYVIIYLGHSIHLLNNGDNT